MNKQSAILTEQDFRDAMSKQCGFPTDDEVLRSLRFAMNPLQLKDRSVLGLPKTDEQRERDNDLEYESRVDYESWQRDGCDGPEERESE